MNIVASVSRINGEAYALRGGEKILLQEGSSLTDDDTVITEDSSVEITFTDKTQVTLSEDTEIMISDYVFTPSDESFLLSITKGTMQSISGEIVKRNPEAFEIQSPKATMGIRGTTTLHTISDSGEENHVVLSISDGHTVHINTSSGSFALLTSSSEGVAIGTGGTAMKPFVLSSSELNEIIQIMDNMENPQDVLQQLNIKLKQIQDTDDTSSTEVQNLQSVTEAIDNITQEGKQLSVVSEEVVAPVNDAELTAEETQNENSEEDGEGLAKEFADSSKSTTEKESTKGSTSQKSDEINSSLSSQAQSTESNTALLTPQETEPTPEQTPEPTPDPTLGLSVSNPIIIDVTPKDSGDIYFTPKDETEIVLGHFENNEKFIVDIENMPQDSSYVLRLTDSGFMFEYNGYFYAINWQEDDILVDHAGTNQENALLGIQEFDFNDADQAGLNYSSIIGSGYGTESKATLTDGDDIFYIKNGSDTFELNGKEFDVTNFNVIDMGDGDNDTIRFDASSFENSEVLGKVATIGITDDGFWVGTETNSSGTATGYTLFENFEKIIISDPSSNVSNMLEVYNIRLNLQGVIDQDYVVSYEGNMQPSVVMLQGYDSSIWSRGTGSTLNVFTCNNDGDVYTLSFVQA